MHPSALALASALAAAAPLPGPCPGPAFLPAGGLPRPTAVPPPPPTGDKAERDALGVTTNRAASENFVIRWGGSGGVTTDEITRLTAAFEAAWQEEVVNQGHPAPIGADTFRFNVYIGDSGGGTPSGYGTGGYFDVDADGYPMIVVSAASLDTPDFADITAAHEFYHAIQGATERFAYAGTGAWYWESTATWASATVYPENPYYAVFLFGYALFPPLPVNFFEYYAEGDLPEYYQYGAFAWPWYLTEVASDRALVRETWTDSSTEPDPLEVLRARLADRGLDIDELWLDHLAANVGWTYIDPTAVSLGLDSSRGYPEWDDVVAATVTGGDSGGWVSGPGALAPYRYGSNTIEIDPGGHSSLVISLDGSATGDRRSPARWGGRLVVESGAGRSELPVGMVDDTSGEVRPEGLRPGDRLTLLVGAWTPSNARWDRERFSYRFSVAPLTGGADGTADDGTADDGAADDGSTDDGSTDGGASDGGGSDGATDGDASDGGGADLSGDGAAGDSAAPRNEDDVDGVKIDAPGCAATGRSPRTFGLALASAAALLGARRRRR